MIVALAKARNDHGARLTSRRAMGLPLPTYVYFASLPNQTTYVRDKCAEAY